MEALIEKCTSEKNTQDNWDLILEVCENYASKDPKTCVKTICKRMFHKNPNVSLRAITLLDACSQNCGKTFNRELASKDFCQTIKKNFSSLQRIPSLKLIEIFKRWADEFKSDSELALAASFYNWVNNEYVDLVKQVMEEKQIAKHGQSRQLVAQLQAKEEKDLAEAIALSLKETTGAASTVSRSNNQPTSLYPTRAQLSFNTTTAGGAAAGSSSSYLTSPTAPKTVTRNSKGYVKALYDFEAAEDNELTFKAGELILLLDDSDENWWLGSNHRGEGLFPAQFVKQLSDTDDENDKKTSQSTHSSEVNHQKSAKIMPQQLDERKIDECLRLITTVDPTGEFLQDPPELKQLEAECTAMLPLVDPELKLIDKKMIMLTELNQRLVDAFQLYHDIMSHQNAATNAYYASASANATAGMMKPPPAPPVMYMPNSANMFPYSSQPVGIPPNYVVNSSNTLPMNGSNMPTESNGGGTMMMPPSDTQSMATGIYANPQTENYTTAGGGNMIQNNVPVNPVPQQFMLQRPPYGMNQAAAALPNVAPQQMPSYPPSVANPYGVPSFHPMTEPPNTMTYPDQHQGIQAQQQFQQQHQQQFQQQPQQQQQQI
ncbi:unnamed protein product [Trichobilharzia szidati]|nr:unnamed protein product [Trichobilharzia szidati]